jgi:glutaredoxin
MSLEIYSKDSCTYCVSVKKFLNSRNVEFVEHKIGENLTVAEFKEKWPEVKGLPLVVDNGKPIPNYVEYLEKKYA